MNEAMQRMLPATVLTLVLHGTLLSWRMQLPETVRPRPLPRKITVSLKRLPPPPPPMKRIVQETPAPPEITPVEYQPVRPMVPKPLKKIIQTPVPPKITPMKHEPIRPMVPKPVRKFSAVPLPPKIAPVSRQPVKPLTPRPVQPIQQQVRPVTEFRTVISRQQPVVRRTTTYQQTYRRQDPVSSRVPRRTTTPVGAGVVREASPLYQSNPPPEYPRMARRRGLEGVVTIEAEIDMNGRVTDLRIFSGSGHQVLDKAALKAVRGWRFTPGTVGGRPQAMLVKVPVRFELH